MKNLNLCKYSGQQWNIMHYKQPLRIVNYVTSQNYTSPIYKVLQIPQILAIYLRWTAFLKKAAVDIKNP